MPYSVLPISGVDLNGVTNISFAYVNGTTAVSIDASTFAATSGGGSYIAPAESMVSGDYGWFGATSV